MPGRVAATELINSAGDNTKEWQVCMQVNLSPNIAGGTPEAASPKADAVDDSASDFFAEMGQAWNAVEQEAAPPDVSSPAAPAPQRRAVSVGTKPSDAVVEQSTGEECGDVDLSMPVVVHAVMNAATPVVMSLDLNAPIFVSDSALLEDAEGRADASFVDESTNASMKADPGIGIAAGVAPSQASGTPLFSRQAPMDGAIVNSGMAENSSNPADSMEVGRSIAPAIDSGTEVESARPAQSDGAPRSTRTGVASDPVITSADAQAPIDPKILERLAGRDAGLTADQGAALRSQPESTSPLSFTHSTDDRQRQDGPAMASENLVATPSAENGPQGERAFIPRNSLPSNAEAPRLVKDALSVKANQGRTVAREAGPASSRIPVQAAASGSQESAPAVVNDTNAGNANAGGEGLPNEKSFRIVTAHDADSSVPGSDAKQSFSIGNVGAETPRASSINMAERGASASSSRESAGAEAKSLVLELAERIQVQVREGRGEVRIQLKPESLGRLEIRAENTANGVVARIAAESGSVKSHLETNMQILQQSLQEQGLRVDRIQIVVQDGFDAQTPSGYHAHSGNSGSGHERGGGRGAGGADGFGENPSDETSPDQAARRSLNPNVRFYTVA